MSQNRCKQFLVAITALLLVPITATAQQPVTPTSQTDADSLYQKATALERSDPNAAIRIYRRAARDGSGMAAKRLGEIYDKGLFGITRDYQESLSWYKKARELGLGTTTPDGIPLIGDFGRQGPK